MQVYDLIAGGLNSERVAKAVTERGIDFEPTEEYLSTLRAKGASQALIDVLRAANPTPLSRSAIVRLLAAGTSDETLAAIVQRRGLDFAASDQDLDTLRLAGAGPLLLKAMQIAPTLGLPTSKLPGDVYDVGGNVMAPVPIYHPDPPYSEEARNAKYSGTVSLMIIVDASGAVTDAQIIKPAGLGLDEKAVEAVRTWKFKPAMRNGVPVRVRLRVEVSFWLKEGPQASCPVPFTLVAAAWNDPHEMKWDWFGEDETYWWGRGGASKYPRLCMTNRQQAEFVIAWRTPSFPNFDSSYFRIEVFRVGHGELGQLFYISKNPSALGAFKDALKHLQNQGK